MSNPDLEEYEDEPKQKFSLKGFARKKIGGYLSTRKKQKQLEKKIFHQEFNAELRRAQQIRDFKKKEKIVAEARKAAQNKAEGYGHILARQFGSGALKVGKGILIGGKKSAPYVKAAVKAAEKATR